MAERKLAVVESHREGRDPMEVIRLDVSFPRMRWHRRIGSVQLLRERKGIGGVRQSCRWYPECAMSEDGVLDIRIQGLCSGGWRWIADVNISSLFQILLPPYVKVFIAFAATQISIM
ncbi:hypothetical protein HCBG_03700 [Histoplasma capsulatum G186AR]|uniref:Uncharacterized protein n=1 Tax=Ajellomyces capsulatus (strain G186AR / H82 / ATCC MYA-2454 / RMSCC 2432) TaxID=447093 RepID=C0NKM0_AJECG|nr:uncharacterized protein HCBG_03700 [Histoplasma capsulatum G186AR]EEH08411.1 hypothetical protein HCBG_03700 [Histoplasma capsulatum G186AR]